MAWAGAAWPQIRLRAMRKANRVGQVESRMVRLLIPSHRVGPRWSRAPRASERVEPHPPQKNLVARILADPIETRMDAEEDDPRGAFLDRDVEPPERFVHVAQGGVERRDPPRRDHALGAGLNQLLKDLPCRSLVSATGLEVP